MKTKHSTKLHKTSATPRSREQSLRSLTANIETLCLVMASEILNKPSAKNGSVFIEPTKSQSNMVVPQVTQAGKQKPTVRTGR